jgi:heat-inducible transcriptional repressor
MSEALSARQTQILKSLIDEYIDTAEPVGSEALEKKYNLGVSPATIRNEMSQLTDSGFLKQPHTSAGRVPTPKAMKFYVNQLMDERQMTVTEEVRAKEEVWDVRDDINALFREATHALAEQTRNLAVGALEDERVWHSGYKNIFLNPEFSDLRTSANLFSLLEEFDKMHEIFFRRMSGTSPVEVLFCEDLGWAELEPVGIAATRFNIGNKKGALAVVGPTRLRYPYVVPALRYYKKLMEEIAGL